MHVCVCVCACVCMCVCTCVCVCVCMHVCVHVCAAVMLLHQYIPSCFLHDAYKHGYKNRYDDLPLESCSHILTESSDDFHNLNCCCSCLHA